MQTTRLAQLILRRYSCRQVYNVRRSFTYSTPVCAAEDDDVLRRIQQAPVFRKLADKPEAILALHRFAEFLKGKGINPATGAQPPTFRLLRLAASTEFQEEIKRVADELQKAGIDLRSKEIINEIMDLSKKSESDGSQ